MKRSCAQGLHGAVSVRARAFATGGGGSVGSGEESQGSGSRGVWLALGGLRWRHRGFTERAEVAVELVFVEVVDRRDEFVPVNLAPVRVVIRDVLAGFLYEREEWLGVKGTDCHLRADPLGILAEARALAGPRNFRF